MLSVAGSSRIMLYMQPTDMRRSFRGLSALIYQHLGRPEDGSYYVFVNRPRTHVKILYFDGDGLAIWYKRLEKGRFVMPRMQADRVKRDRRQLAMHLPLYRQEERLHNLGIEVSRQTLSRLYMKAAEVLLPVYLLMKEAILARKIIFTDDTPVRLQVPGNRKTVTGRMWVYIGGGNGPPFRVFEFTRDRCKKRPKEFLGDFKGYIHADAYKGYDDLFARDGVHECACWMHVRRKYVDARDAPVQLRDSVLRAIRHIFRYDRFARNHPDNSDELILAVRHEKIAPLIDWLFARTARALKEGEVLPGSAFAAAIGYMHGLDEALRTFLNHPQLMPDNGQSERAIRPLAIGRRNWLFAGSKRGGDATGVLLSIVQSCRAAGLDPFTYLQDVLRRINGHSANRIHELLPTKDWKPAETYYG
jgi:transposase